MAIYEKTKSIRTVKDLREFLEEFPDETKIMSDMREAMTANKMVKGPKESGPKVWILLEEA